VIGVEARLAWHAFNTPVQILFGHTKVKNTVGYLSVDNEHALLLAEPTGI